MYYTMVVHNTTTHDIPDTCTFEGTNPQTLNLYITPLLVPFSPPPPPQIRP